MQQFIPFEDEWDILERLSPESLIPYQVGVTCRQDQAANDHATGQGAPSGPAVPIAPALAGGART